MRVRGNRCAGWRRAASLSPSSVFLLRCKTTRPSSRGSSCSAAPTWPWDEMPSGSGWRREVNQDFLWWSCSSACTDCPYFVKCRRSNVVCVFLCSSFFLCGVSEPRSDICTCLIETCRYCCYCTVIFHRNLLHIILITKHFIFFIHFLWVSKLCLANQYCFNNLLSDIIFFVKWMRRHQWGSLAAQSIACSYQDYLSIHVFKFIYILSYYNVWNLILQI